MAGSKMQAVASLLTALKVDLKQFPWITSDADAPEDFSPDEFAEEYLETRKQVAESELDVQKQITDALKEQESAQYTKILKSVKAKLKRKAHFEIPNEEKDIEKILDAYQNAVGSKEGDQEKEKLIQKLNEEYTKAIDKIEVLESEKAQLAEHNTRFEAEYKERLKSQEQIDGALSSVTWAETGENLKERQRTIKRDIEELFKVNADGSITDKDGKPVMRPDGTGRIKSVTEYVDNYADRLKLRKVSNGLDDFQSPKGIVIPEGQEGESMRQKLRERKQFIAQKAKEHGIPVEEAEAMFAQ